jgi:hypothetical protein
MFNLYKERFAIVRSGSDANFNNSPGFVHHLVPAQSVKLPGKKLSTHSLRYPRGVESWFSFDDPGALPPADGREASVKAPTSGRRLGHPRRRAHVGRSAVAPEILPAGEPRVREPNDAADAMSAESHAAFPTAPNASADPKTTQTPVRIRRNEAPHSPPFFSTAPAFRASS